MSDNQIAKLKPAPSTTAKAEREYGPQSTIGLKDANGENYGLVNLAGPFKDQEQANQALESFMTLYSKLTPELKAKCKFILMPNGKGFRLAAPNNQTIGFLNAPVYDMTNVDFSTLVVAPYAHVAVTEQDFASMFGL